MALMFQRMVIAGVGLIGGSLALAARERGLVGEVIGYGRGAKNLRWARRRGIIDRYFLRPQDIPESFGADEDTWYFPRVCGTFKERQGWHPCQMPESLLSRIVTVSSNRGDCVLDPQMTTEQIFETVGDINRQWTLCLYFASWSVEIL